MYGLQWMYLERVAALFVYALKIIGMTVSPSNVLGHLEGEGICRDVQGDVSKRKARCLA